MYYLALPMQSGQSVRFRLDALRGGRRIKSDPRIMNFRVTRCAWSPGPEARIASRSSAGSFNFRPEFEDVQSADGTKRRSWQQWLRAGMSGRWLPRLIRHSGRIPGLLADFTVAELNRMPLTRALLQRLAEHPPAREDIAAADLGLRFGGGWGPPLHDKGIVSRWAGDETWLAIRAPEGPTRILCLELEPGPDLDSRPLELTVCDADGETIHQETIVCRHVLYLPLSGRAGQTQRFYLRVDRPGAQSADRAATRLYRVFYCGLSSPGIISPLGLHTCACGDWTMLAREHWFALRGYAELDIFSLHIDSLLCFAAHHAGFEEVVLKDPMRTYHIEHGIGSGWTPEGESLLFSGLARKGIPYLECRTVLLWATDMRRMKRPMCFSDDSWGFGEEQLPETRIGALQREHRAVA
jgi:hypothetical protein